MSSSNAGADQAMDLLLEAQAHIWNHCYSFQRSMCLKCAVELGIPDAICANGGPMTLNQLMEATPVVRADKAHALYRIMRFLVHMGCFELTRAGEDEVEAYSLSHVSKLLLRDNPLSLEPYVRMTLDMDVTKTLGSLVTWLQNDDVSAVQTSHGVNSMWEFFMIGNNPELGQAFNRAMASDARLVATVVIDRCKPVFEGLKSLVDVGGGTGEMCKAIADEFPNMECTVLDLPQVVTGLEGTRNLKYIGGDMFDNIPPANAVLLKCVLHDWGELESIKLLKKCKEALPSKEEGGKLIIIEIVMDDSTSPGDKLKEAQLLTDISLISIAGLERHEKEWAKLFAEAGFSSYKIISKLGVHSIIEVYP